jgi:sphingomyelin synthase-related protein 1
MYLEHRALLSLFADSPRSYHLLHFLSWIMAITGMFFILAGHQHYSIDILVAWVLSSRLFIYYHTYDTVIGTGANESICLRFLSSLANNRTYLQRDKNRMRIWFPFFSYFEENVKQAIPNEYCLPDIVYGTCTKLHSCLDQMRYPTD